MPMDASRQERWAASVVAARLGVELRFVDTDGRVDYRFTDGAGRSAAMEVTTLTDEVLKGSVDAYARTRNTARLPAPLGSCWTVAVDERLARFKGLEGQLQSHLALLEEVGVERGRWLTPREVRLAYGSVEVEATVADLGRKMVRQVLRWTTQTCAEDGDRRGPHSHEIQVSTTGDFEEVGADVALEEIEKFVVKYPDNLRKLAAADAEVKHLFLCLDEQTSVGVSHAVSRRFAAPPVNGRDYFGLPRRPPSLPAEVDELWVVYEFDGEGWHWGGGRWEQFEGVPIGYAEVDRPAVPPQE